MDISEIDKPTVCIVRLQDDSQNPAVLFQVTIDPTLVSPSGAYMRFGQSGDEITGWKWVGVIEIIEVLGWPTGDVNANGQPIIQAAPRNDGAVIQMETA